MLYNLLHCLSGRSEILTRIEVRRIESKVLADCGGACKTEVGVDVDLADCHRSCFTEHIFGNALCAGHTSAVLVDDLDEVLRNGRSTVQNDGESGQTLADFFENVKTKLRLTFELVCAVRRADCDCKRIYAGFVDEFFNLVGIGELSVFCRNVDCVFDACEFAEFCLDYHTVIVSVFDYLLCDADIFCKRMCACVNHNGSKAVVNAVFAEREAIAVIEVQADRKTASFDCCLNHLGEIGRVCVFSCAGRYLKDKRSLLFGSRFDDTLDNLHIVDVESTDCVTACVCFLNISVVVTNGIVVPPKILFRVHYTTSYKKTQPFI